tara:strand:+ start:792 stop:938 length:147 start_codon:yes stop_codon:yes gene_type:complete
MLIHFSQAASDEGCKSFANIVDHFFARGSTAAKGTTEQILRHFSITVD